MRPLHRTPPKRRQNSRTLAPAGRQRGQALVFVTVAVLVMVIAMMVTYNIGQLTNQKTKLQNTADAAAYSAAVAQARDYNFSAYMNRAMIANDVVVAQFVALRSWTENYNETFKTKGLTEKADPGKSGGGAANSVQGGPLYPLWTVQETTARVAAKALQATFKTGANTMVPFLQGMNTGFAVTQKVYHFSSALTVAQILGVDDKFNAYMRSIVGFDLRLITDLIKFGNSYNVVKMNEPQAALSLLGFASYAYGMSEWNKFTSVRNPLGPWGKDTSDQSYTWQEDHCGGWSIFGSCLWGEWTETHYVTDISTKEYKDDGTFDGPSKDRYTGVVSSSLDGFTTDRNGNWYLPFLIDPVLLIGPAAQPNKWFLKMLFHDASGVELWNDERGDTIAGAGKGYKKLASWNHRWHGSDSTTFLGLATISICGIPFWGCINPPAIPYKSGLNFDQTDVGVSTGNASGGSKEGIHISNSEIFRQYRDVSNVKQGTSTENQNWTAPPILVEVERKTSGITTTQSLKSPGYAGCAFGTPSTQGQKVSAVFAEGNFTVGDGSSANCMRAMAKAEAYFSRPTDLFARGDGKTEYGSLYSPYWQARLVKTTTAEQQLSLITHFCTNQTSVASCATKLIKDFALNQNTFYSALKSAFSW